MPEMLGIVAVGVDGVIAPVFERGGGVERPVDLWIGDPVI